MLKTSLALAVSLAGFTTTAQAEITWKESYYNPNPMDGDLVLPMPCGGAMTFRKVETPNSDGAIGDVPVLLGEEGDNQPYLNGLRQSYVSGAFSDDGSGSNKGHFYLAKYELAEAQYAVIAEGCPDRAPRKRAFKPVVDLSKLEFEQFAQDYTLWLMKEAADALPKADDTKAYIRLPTEEEWEFAARGGLAVEPAEFRQPFPPLQDGTQTTEYVAHGGTESAGGKLQAVGTLLPNPLGLHDMLGNASEIVSTPFALVRHGRLHGQAGGFVKRGGDARTPLGSMNSATRYEVAPFDLRATDVTRDRYTGARMAIAGLAITSSDQAEDLAKALDEIAALDSRMAAEIAEQDVLEVIDALAKDARNEQTKASLAVIEDTIKRARAERNAQRDQSIRLILNSGTLHCDQAVQAYINALALVPQIEELNDIIAEARENGDLETIQAATEILQEAQQGVRDLENRIDGEIVEYNNLAEGLVKDYSIELLRRQAGFIEDKVRARGDRRASCLITLRNHLAAREAAGFIDSELVKLDFQGIALAAVE
ncbi:MAG: SUMF1/EgtB/PvdO family nonheme iron enzyme [Litoreibacter sp.]|nr:SUMF1/EgtB/PvdO family nonheme iron enzyme [Litoreibacter sp.]